MILSHDLCIALNTLLHTAVEQRELSGVVVQVANQKEVLYSGAFGNLDEQGEVAMPMNAVFQIMSMTKPITSFAIMMLNEQGFLTLDDHLSMYLPELKGLKVIMEVNETNFSYTTRPALTEITLRHLLTHTAGFGYKISSNIFRILSEKFPAIPPLLHEPGSRWTYGMSTRFLGKVIEKVTNEPLDKFFESRIFRPLGMKDTGFTLKSQESSRLVSLFQRFNGKLIAAPKREPYIQQVFGDSGLLSTASDYTIFLQMLLNKGKFGNERLLNEKSIDDMINNQIGNLFLERQFGGLPSLSNPFPIGIKEDKFGFGFQIKEKNETGRRARGSYSWAGLYNTYFWNDPISDISVVFLTQMLPFYDMSCISILDEFEKKLYEYINWKQ